MPSLEPVHRGLRYQLSFGGTEVMSVALGVFPAYWPHYGKCRKRD